MDGSLPTGPGPQGAYEERAQSPSQEPTLQQEPAIPRPEKRKLPPSASHSPAPSEQPSTTGAQDAPEPSTSSITQQYPSIAPLPLFAPPPPTLPSHAAFEFFSTRSHPFNKHGFRYTPCGPSPNSPLPVPPQRMIESIPQKVRWSWEDRSVFTFLTTDAQTVTTDKGWRGIRTNVGLRHGEWFWEFTIERAGGAAGGGRTGDGDGSGEANSGEPTNSWVRVGVGRRESGLNAPVGVDGYSYGIRDKTGDKVHKSHPEQYGKPFSSGTTIGVYLSLPPPAPIPSTASVRDPHRIMRKRVPILYKNQLYFEQLEYGSSKEMDGLLVDPVLKAKQAEAEEKKKKTKLLAAPGTKVDSSSRKDQGPPMRELPTLPGSKLGFWIDGEFQGVAFEDLYDFIPLMKHSIRELGGIHKKEKTNRLVTENHHDDGTTGYYPFVSVFGGGIVTINPGPDFKHAPSADDLVRFGSPSPTRHDDTNGGGAGGSDASENGTRRWKPLCDRYQEFYDEQRRLDDVDELAQIKLLIEVRAKEQARAQRQAERAEGAAAKRAKTSATASTPTPSFDMAPGSGAGLALSQFQNQVIGTAKGQEESPGNSPRPPTMVPPLPSSTSFDEGESNYAGM
ncbi:hypothetical protein JCM3766R1_000305 [Sporobolomyces carnicolor]